MKKWKVLLGTLALSLGLLFTFSSYETASAATWHYGIPKVLQGTRWRGKMHPKGSDTRGAEAVKFWKTRFYFVTYQNDMPGTKCYWKKVGRVYTVRSRFYKKEQARSLLKVKRINRYKIILKTGYTVPDTNSYWGRPKVMTRVPFN